MALIGLARPAAAGEDRFYLDFDLPAANQASASSFALSPAGSNPSGGLKGLGVSMGYALPRESGEWRIAAGLGQQSPFALQEAYAGELAALRGETGEADTSATVSLLYAFDLGEEGLFGMNMQPYLGGGIGLTRRPGDGASGTAGLSAEEADRERYNLSWGLTAGVNMPLSSNLNLSLAYRYVGQGESDRATLDREAGDPDADLHSHDLMLIFGVSF
ncbi:MAG: outer membrane beta-barrel protein [Kiloniellales bacterium]|nr:outer membrane beta-barrel protein [Kiloniellales bacterium]